MASIWWEETVETPADIAWQALRRTDQAHRLFSPVLVDGNMEGDVREVTFSNGKIVQERIIDVDDQRRRLAYTVLNMFEHHSASMQIVPVDEETCRFVWITDFLPAERRETVLPLVQQGARALAANLEKANISV
jgi:Polyketide cyclase / dehydrase and lipid transport